MSEPRRVATHSAELMITAEQTWRMIIDPSLLALWYAFGGVSLEPEPGGRIELRFGADQAFRGQVETVEPPRRLIYRLAQEAGLEPTSDNSTRVELAVRPSTTDGRSVITVTESEFEHLAAKYTPFESYRAAQVAWIGAFGLLVQATGIPPTPESANGHH